MPAKPDLRRDVGLEWARQQWDWEPTQIDPISSDASFRRYFRLRNGSQSVVLMDAPPDREPVDPFIDVAGRLAPWVQVPSILAADVDRGFLLLSDLGDEPYHHILDSDNADRLFNAAIVSLIKIQSHADSRDLSAYEPALLMRELDLFLDWFVRKHWSVDPSDAELDAWDHVCALLIRWALDQTQVFCHRDFMPRNLMVGETRPGILDFQDAVLGPISYDPVCLYRDAFLSWPKAWVDQQLEQYRQRAAAAGLTVPNDPDLWRRTCDFMGVQRHLKVIGIFARIRYRDGKPRYLEDKPRFFAYLDSAIARNPELATLGHLIESWASRQQSSGS